MSLNSLATQPGPRARLLLIGTAAGLLAGAVLAPALGPRAARAVDDRTPPEHSISVSGLGRILLRPDIADLRLGVTISRPTVAAARQAAAEQMARVVAALKSAGVADADIQTATLALHPEYDQKPTASAPGITGYSLSNVVSVRVRDLDAIDKVVDGAIGAGATNVDGLAFRVEDQTRAEAQAREAAMRDARTKADQLARAAGVSITGLISVTETQGPIPYPMAERAAADTSATPIQTGTNEVTVTVTVVYLVG